MFLRTFEIAACAAGIAVLLQGCGNAPATTSTAPRAATSTTSSVHTTSSGSIVFPEVVHPGSFYWQMQTHGNSIAGAGFSFYTRIFSLFSEGIALDMQMGMGGTWLTPTNITWGVGDTCACNPKGWPSATLGDQAFGCCEKPTRCSFLYETFEGGPGYWIGQLPTKTPKWRVNSAVGCYKSQTSTPLFDFGASGAPHACLDMGIAQLSNRMLMAPDGVTFQDGKQGMVGVSYVRTPLGKVDAGDDRNFWTIVIDTANFAGPLAYFIPEFWAERWDSPQPSPGSASLGDLGKAGHGLRMGGGAFEWNTLYNYKSASGAYKIPAMTMPLDDEGQTTLFKDARGYEDRDIYDPLETALASGSLDPLQIMMGGAPILCVNGTGPATYRLDGSNRNNKYLVNVGELRTSVDAEGNCRWTFAPDASNARKDGSLPQYFSAQLQPMSESEAPPELVAQKFATKKDMGPYDGLNKEPAGGCAGDVKKDLHCARTTSPSWIAYRWYRFVDQPTMARASLTSAQKDFLQARVEKLHKMLAEGGDRAGKWIKEKGKAEELALVDRALLVTPPKGMEVGYVPVVMYEGTAKPDSCSSHNDPLDDVLFS